MAQHSKGRNICPHWSAKDSRCTVSADGLFIPPESHIISYCNSDNHTNCSQYKAELSRQASAGSTIKLNRRKDPRTPVERKVTLYQVSDSEAISRQPEGVAHLVDLSAGGMRIDYSEPLTLDTVLDFTFDSATTIHPIKRGTAQVKWCVFEKESKKYYAGLAFRQHSYPNSAGLRIEPFAH